MRAAELQLHGIENSSDSRLRARQVRADLPLHRAACANDARIQRDRRARRRPQGAGQIQQKDDQPIPLDFDGFADLLSARWTEFCRTRRYAASWVTDEERAALETAWDLFAHRHQRAPEFAGNGRPWTTWLILGGRGAGKTRAGAEWVREVARDKYAHIALIGKPSTTRAR